MAGAGYKLFASGDVLTAAQVNTYLQEQAVMVFASSAARTTAISGVLAEGMVTYLQDTNTIEVYDGAAWIPASLTNSFYAGKNVILNADCRIAQRGTSAVTLTSANVTYFVDRFFGFRALGTSGATATQISSIGLTNFQNAMRLQRTAGDTSTADLSIGQTLTSNSSIPLAGRTVTLSFWARAGANFSAASNVLRIRLYSGTGTDQGGLGYNFTGTATPISANAVLTTSWVRYSASGTIASTATQLQAFLYYTPVGTAGANDSVDITGVQLEVGSTATAFQLATGNPASELEACQRFYQRISNSAQYDFLSNLGSLATTTQGFFTFPIKTSFRAKPTTLEYANVQLTSDDINAVLTMSALILYHQSADNAVLYSTNAAGTQFRPYWLYATSATVGASYIGISAEL